jgi:DNA-binding NtrC family response regulator
LLVVDDEAAVLKVLGLGMRAQGFQVWLAANASEALAIYGCYRERIDVVLIDVRMPKPDGPETVATLQTLDPNVNFCFMTADLGQYTERELLDRGACAVFRKPLQFGELATSLSKIVVFRPQSSISPKDVSES